jgi:hypothetical protein
MILRIQKIGKSSYKLELASKDFSGTSFMDNPTKREK